MSTLFLVFAVPVFLWHLWREPVGRGYVLGGFVLAIVAGLILPGGGNGWPEILLGVGLGMWIVASDRERVGDLHSEHEAREAT